MYTLFNIVQHGFATVYSRACGGVLQPAGVEPASPVRRPICVFILFLMAAPLLGLSLPIEWLVPNYLRFLVPVWIGGVFFFMASVDRRAARLQTVLEGP